MKGPIDWLNTIDELLKCNINVEATWIGDGTLLPFMRETVSERKIGDRVRLPGFASQRSQLLTVLKDSDIFLFCHKTRESARAWERRLPAVARSSVTRAPIRLISSL